MERNGYDFRHAKYMGQSVWRKYNSKGEVVAEVAADEFDVPVEDRNNKREKGSFAILYLFKFYSLLDELGGKKWKVIDHIIHNMDYNNMLVTTCNNIASATGVSEKTVRETLKKLKEADLIAHKPGLIMLSPKLLNRKHQNGENVLMLRYEDLTGNCYDRYGNIIKPPKGGVGEDSPTTNEEAGSN